MKLELSAPLFHVYENDCPGVIVSRGDGWLVCAECGKPVGQLDAGLLAQIIHLLDRLAK